MNRSHQTNDTSEYFSENAAVRRITPRGEVSTLASNIVVDDCQPLPGASPRLGPFLRGLDVAPDGSVYVAANGCCALLKIAPQGPVTPVLRSISPWSPTGVAVHGDAVFVLEYLHTVSGDRRDWTPRVRKLSRDGTATVLAAVERTSGGGSRSALIPATNTFDGANAGDEIEVNGVKLCWCPPGKFIINTFEWCRDWHHSRLPGGFDPDLYAAQSTAALNRTGDHSRVRRGGAWTDDGWACRSAFRLRFEPHRRYDHIGFRVVAVPP